MGQEEVLYETKRRALRRWIELVFIQKLPSFRFSDLSILRKLEKRFSFFQWKFENLILEAFVQRRPFFSNHSLPLLLFSFSFSATTLRIYRSSLIRWILKTRTRLPRGSKDELRERFRFRLLSIDQAGESGK